MNAQAYTPEHYRLTDPFTRLSVQLQVVPGPDGQLHTVPRLVPGSDATRFTTRDAANAAWALHVGVAPLELERIDA